jgi:hypothetical protein
MFSGWFSCSRRQSSVGLNGCIRQLARFDDIELRSTLYLYGKNLGKSEHSSGEQAKTHRGGVAIQEISKMRSRNNGFPMRYSSVGRAVQNTITKQVYQHLMVTFQLTILATFFFSHHEDETLSISTLSHLHSISSQQTAEEMNTWLCEKTYMQWLRSRRRRVAQLHQRGSS